MGNSYSFSQSLKTQKKSDSFQSWLHLRPSLYFLQSSVAECQINNWNTLPTLIFILLTVFWVANFRSNPASRFVWLVLKVFEVSLSHLTGLTQTCFWFDCSEATVQSSNILAVISLTFVPDCDSERKSAPKSASLPPRATPCSIALPCIVLLSPLVPCVA